jgi:hypothetical protein
MQKEQNSPRLSRCPAALHKLGKRKERVDGAISILGSKVLVFNILI